MNGTGWSSNQDAALARLWGEKVAATTIGRTIGRTTSAVTGRAHVLGLPARKRGEVARFDHKPAKSKPRRHRKITSGSGRAKRTCLGCGALFDSEWIGNRRCLKCKSASAGMFR